MRSETLALSSLAVFVVLVLNGCGSNKPSPQVTTTPSPVAPSQTLQNYVAIGDCGQVRKMLNVDRSLVNTLDRFGWTVLQRAANPGGRSGPMTLLGIPIGGATTLPDCVATLIDHGADVNIRARNGATALHVVVSYPYIPPDQRRNNIVNGEPFADLLDRAQLRSLNLILAAKPDINPKMTDGDTPLHLASHFGRSEMARQLLKAGADRNIRNGDGKTAAEVASAEKFEDLARELDAK